MNTAKSTILAGLALAALTLAPSAACAMPLAMAKDIFRGDAHLMLTATASPAPAPQAILFGWFASAGDYVFTLISTID